MVLTLDAADRRAVEADTAISVRGVAVQFDSATGPVLAVDDVSFQVASGDFVTLLGPSGCGKSTLLRVIADLVSPTRGSVEVFGSSPHAARLNGDFGFVFQDAALLPWHTVLDNVMFPARVGAGRRSGRRTHEVREEARDLLSLVGLTGREKAFPRELSGGMRQRVSLARALLLRPRILLMDEPFGALDEITRDTLNDELLRVWEQVKTSVVFVTHSIAEAVYLSRRVIVMGTRPGCIRNEMMIPVSYPRTNESRDTRDFTTAAAALRGQLRGSHDARNQ